MSKTTRDRLSPVDDTTEWPLTYKKRHGTYHTRCADTDYEPVSTTVLMAVSSVVGTEPDDLESLSACVDPDALNAIVVNWYEDGSRASDGSITFPFNECLVTVHADGEVVIDPDHSDGGGRRVHL
ncbi:HalOD1 output domain-containing protein [Natronorubrum bangense]|uniref:Halobacterial output domain-containing protein n=2 Tax=Natronorubrum bangense TaxID=61858 RepID=L9WEQ1_9EURY|nr:HalOD1 output domain-containing protein [Natronorubrum bangense]ELY47965.1 hypothetical protein C494_12225 [Natronorubrum bangense JCM 10635]QCC53573.1 hypothetical protein DV706_03195 [Natronorubrum bangense]